MKTQTIKITDKQKNALTITAMAFISAVILTAIVIGVYQACIGNYHPMHW